MLPALGATDRLGRLALRQRGARRGGIGTIGVGADREAGSKEAQYIGGRHHRAVAGLERRWRQPDRRTIAHQHLDFGDGRPGFATPGTGVHRQRAADGARNAGHVAKPGELLALGELGQTRAVQAGFGVQAIRGFEPQFFKRAVQRDHRAAEAAIADQQVRAEAQPQHRLVGRQLADEGDQIVAVGRLEVAIGRTANAPAGVARQRLAGTDDAANADRVRLAHHWVASAGPHNRKAASCRRPTPIALPSIPRRSRGALAGWLMASPPFGSASAGQRVRRCRRRRRSAPHRHREPSSPTRPALRRRS